jgi:drug/metabolite transporter (DMT)-like permease
MWIILSLSAAICFAIVHVLDEYCVDEIFDKPWIGTITSALATIVVFMPLPYILPFTGWQWPAASVVVAAVFSGMLIQTSQLLYFNALARTNASTVATYWNMIPAILPIFSFVLLGKVLTPYQYIGIIILIFASNLMLLADHNLDSRVSALILMVGASVLQAFSYLIQDFIYDNTTYLEGFVLFTLGIVSFGLAPLVWPSVQKTLSRGKAKLTQTIHLFLAIEIINIFALAFAQKGIQLGVPSLVAAVETTMPGFTFLIAMIALFILKTSYDEKVLSGLGKKFSALGLMIIGVYFVS